MNPRDPSPRAQEMPEKAAQEQQQQQPSESHAGQGSDSAMKQMQVWEQNRASQGGKPGREGAN